MNTQHYDILNYLCRETFVNQRDLAEACGHSLGVVNRCLKELIRDGYLTETLALTQKTLQAYRERSPQSAVILAAGYGMRMVPINTETPKAFLEVNGERLIERLIKQLHEVGIQEIYLVVGFMKEHFEYLIDAYGVKLIVNAEYSEKNNLHSLKYALRYMSNTYILPCDIWCKQNPFRAHELSSWYMVSDCIDNESDVRVNRKRESVKISGKPGGNRMIGIAYLLKEDTAVLQKRIPELASQPKFDNAFWEEALYCNSNRQKKMLIPARVVSAAEVVEIDTYEQLREMDSSSKQLKSGAISCICKALKTTPEHIRHISVLKKGMTNRSFLFECANKKHIMRIPGEGTDQLINRAEEAAVYQTIGRQDLSDRIVYIHPQNGYKITEYWEGARVCDPNDREDLERCMKKLRELHEMALVVEHEFDIFERIEFYEALWEGTPSAYSDYPTTKRKVLSLKEYVDKHKEKKVLTHIDAVPDNFLFVPTEEAEPQVRLIDWEYAGMQDPHVDIAMFCLYAMYDKEQVDRLIDLYFSEGCPGPTRTKIYCYLSLCGLLWSNWCEYKRQLGIEFGEYSLCQYRYAKEYYRMARERMEKEENDHA